jgi:IS5 family transposase
MRKIILLTGDLCEGSNITDWRQYQFRYRSIKKLMRSVQNKKRGNAKSAEKKKIKEEELKKSHQIYINACSAVINKADQSLEKIPDTSVIVGIKKQEIMNFISHGKRQIDQIHRRVILGETISHDEKIFSIFETHTEWVVKGKAGVPVELGLRVCVVEDQYQFILHHQVMEKETDDQVCISITKGAKERFPMINQMSYDKGFHSPANQNDLKDIIDFPVLCRKGKLSKQVREIENSPEFRKARRQHCAVESAINALGVHGLDYCPDHGIYGFKRYVSLAIVGRNIQRIGSILQDREQKKIQRNSAKYHNNRYGHLEFRLAA